MAKRYMRAEIIERLHDQIRQGKAILMLGAGTGLTAKCADIGRADLIGIYTTAHYRMMGQPSLLAWLPYSHANEHVVSMAREILPAVKDAPCIAGIGAHDPALNMERFIDELMDLEFSGITNEPFVGIYGREFAEQLEAAGIGFSREVKLIETAHRKDVFTVGWAFTPEEGRIMAQAGADVIGAIVGVTTGGMTGAKQSKSLEDATKEVQEICIAAKEVNPDVLILTHGGPFNDVLTACYSVINSDAVGYAAGSSGERLPTETAVVQITEQFKGIKLG
ncbi:MAG TPA: phosphoenolpyruvate hydrolase family protein [Syntrophomonadaceae bacterium]|nr:phosphoenolpyruvate hydrolase family protein [Syntrophomonadaceae bacterium]